MMAVKTVLFLCTANSARSQMAEALLRSLAGDRFEVCSAGLEPKTVHPMTLKVLNEIGVDTSALHAKSLSEFLGKRTVHYAIIVCSKAETSCPSLYPFATSVLSWPFPDPAAEQDNELELLRRFRDVRDQIKTQLTTWLREEEDQHGTINGTGS